VGVEITVGPPQPKPGGSGLPDHASSVNASATGAASAISAAIPATAGAFSYLTGFVVTGAGATGASNVVVTVTGVSGAPLSFVVAVPAGVTTAIVPITVILPTPIAATALNTAVTVNVPSFGAGNTNAAVSVFGYTSPT